MKRPATACCVVLLGACAAAPEVPAPGYEGLPDLVVQAFIPPVIFAGAGDTIYLSYLVTNIGSNVAAETTIRYYISADPAVDISVAHIMGDQPLRALAPGESDESMEHPFVIPEGAGDPPLYLAACVDAARTVDETHEDNNCTNSGAGPGYLQFDGGVLVPDETDPTD